MSTKFDLFAALGQLSKRDMHWFDKQDEDTKKAASAFIMQRWMTGTSDIAQIIRINTFI